MLFLLCGCHTSISGDKFVFYSTSIPYAYASEFGVSLTREQITVFKSVAIKMYKYNMSKELAVKELCSCFNNKLIKDDLIDVSNKLDDLQFARFIWIVADLNE